MILQRAVLDDLPRLLQFRRDAAAWLAPLGSDQWALPFPSEHIARSIQAGEVFVARDRPGHDAAACITLDTEADPLLWTDKERQESALYVHKLTVDRRFAGQRLGSRLLDWAGDQAATQGAQWVRLDAWTTNHRLQRYYLEEGFLHIRTVLDPELGGSGWVAQRPSRRVSAGKLDLTYLEEPGFPT